MFGPTSGCDVPTDTHDAFDFRFDQLARVIAVLVALLTFGSMMSTAPSADAQRDEAPFDESEVFVEANENPDEAHRRRRDGG